MTNSIITITLAVAFAVAVVVKFGGFVINNFRKTRKLRIQSKSGEIVELDLEKKNDIDTVNRFTEIFLGLK
ncbi:hypothetical protein [Chitinophaga filiformis]|uniref:Uncharacterized protein n=1 Tax=Chitinophaga filiformis TaxID=104663 RepID=A0A1G7JUG7_CHIFI|nr:hypothetical protein [Chitinophaga filiformis]SDF28586.1 hypothetical protein SAMN04488121_1011374 [Chitinophaga filiformis]